ncbi:hypothetical protein [Amycolatopsis sp. NPDC054798]
MLRHPEAGELTARTEVLALMENPDQGVLIRWAAGGVAQAALTPLPTG